MAEPAASSEADSGTSALAVSLRGVTKVYDNGVMALGPLDLDVAQASSSRCSDRPAAASRRRLRLIAGLNAPTSGSVGVSRRADQARAGHSIGFVFQEPTLMPWASVRENVRLPLKLARVPAAEADARVSEALAQVGLVGIRRRVSRANCRAA